MEFDLRDLVITLLSVLIALPAAYFSVKKRIVDEFTERLRKISGGQLSTIEDLVAVALTEKRLREDTPIDVYGREQLWRELRHGRFLASRLVEDSSSREPPAKVAVVEVRDGETDEPTVRSRSEPYVLIYKEGRPYRGEWPAGAKVTFANSPITLDARLMEALRHMEARA